MRFFLLFYFLLKTQCCVQRRKFYGRRDRMEGSYKKTSLRMYILHIRIDCTSLYGCCCSSNKECIYLYAEVVWEPKTAEAAKKFLLSLSRSSSFSGTTSPNKKTSIIRPLVCSLAGFFFSFSWLMSTWFSILLKWAGAWRKEEVAWLGCLVGEKS